MCSSDLKREIHLSQRWKKSWHENILTSFGILAIYFYSDIRVKGYRQNTKTSQNISMPRFFHLWLKRISLFLFMFPHIFDSPNSSKATSQLIFTLGFSWLYVCMLSSLVYITYKRKIYVMSIFYRKLANFHIYM